MRYIHLVLIVWTSTQILWGSTPSLPLSDQEKSYLAQHPVITMCNNPNWKPIEFFNKKNSNHVQGIAIDTLQYLAKQLHVTFRHIPTQSWSQSQAFLKDKKCDILPAAVQTKQREQYAAFTQPYLDYPLAIITTKEKRFVRELDDLTGETFTRKKGSGLITKMRKLYPGITILETDTYLQSFRKVASGNAYYTIATLPVASYFIGRYQLNNLYIAGYTSMHYRLSIAVRKDAPQLVSLFNKALAHIPGEEQKSIFNRWTNIRINEKVSGISPRVLYGIGILAALLISMGLLWYYLLKKRIQESSELIDAIMEGVLLYKDDVCIDVNDSLVKMLGHKTKEELIGNDILSYISPRSFDTLLAHILNGNDASYELTALRKDGREFPVLVRGRSIRSQSVRLVSMIDMTTIKNQEYIISQQAKQAALGEMIGNIAHQWRQPLSTISATATGLKMQSQHKVLDNAHLTQSCDAINEQAQYLSRTIDDFRNFIKGDRQKKTFRLHDTAEYFLKLTSGALDAHRIELECNIPETIQLNGYENELIQCFINILNNAKDAFHNKSISQRAIQIAAKTLNDHVVITFLDNAGGIPDDVLPKIFEPYFTTKHKASGTGLGLHMTYKLIVDGMGGNIQATNAVYHHKGQEYPGACFTITLPMK